MKRPKKIYDLFVEKIRRYPELYQSPTQIANHILCAIGNGYEWVDGEIKSVFKEPKPFKTTKTAIKKHREEHIKDIIQYGKQFEESQEEIQEKIDKFNRGEDQYQKYYESIIEDAEIIAQCPMQIGYDIYMLYSDSLICCIPDNITDDYKELIEEFCNTVLLLSKNYDNIKFIIEIQNKIESWKK